ncbi:hypothetical protein HYH03_006788 [Edaphochlamys debaryana]|uniref:Heterokaryon incompatibility domain-containing protein n=1 Tax=Edaphochlamys debaryana TaxID=47281 RepID=A0A835Y274_9CHLO|nr:hypothetical protein HYH03_006788 [Edaphochlamys debaryana]|eukprot:KAG2495182.1 hypothetical protein HYH03_006788 [Edaphochlamys debaryana]
MSHGSSAPASPLALASSRYPLPGSDTGRGQNGGSPSSPSGTSPRHAWPGPHTAPAPGTKSFTNPNLQPRPLSQTSRGSRNDPDSTASSFKGVVVATSPYIRGPRIVGLNSSSRAPEPGLSSGLPHVCHVLAQDDFGVDLRRSHFFRNARQLRVATVQSEYGSSGGSEEVAGRTWSGTGAALGARSPGAPAPVRAPPRSAWASSDRSGTPVRNPDGSATASAAAAPGVSAPLRSRFTAGELHTSSSPPMPQSPLQPGTPTGSNPAPPSSADEREREGELLGRGRGRGDFSPKAGQGVAVAAATGPALQAAAHAGDLAEVERLLSAGVDPNTSDPAGRTALFLAAAEGHEGVARALLRAGANPDAPSRVGYGPLGVAAARGQAAVVRALIGGGARLESTDRDGRTPLLAAALRGHVDAGASPEAAAAGGVRALHLAARGGHVDLCRTLMLAGVQEDAVDVDGRTPLALAAASGHGPAVQALLLLSGGAVKDLADKGGRTALALAAEKGSAEAVKALLAAGAKLDLADVDGYTPLHLAARQGNTEAALVLLAAGATPSAPAKDGSTPLSLARANCHTEVVWLLRQQQQSAGGAGSGGGGSAQGNAAEPQARSGQGSPAKRGQGTPSGATASSDVGSTSSASAAGAASNPQQPKGQARARAPPPDPLAPQLLAAVVGGDLGEVQRLLAAGARPDAARDQSGRSVLLLAVSGGRADVVAALGQGGAAVSRADKAGLTPLHVAVSLGQLAVVRVLVEAGADPRAADKEGRTPLLLAEAQGLQEVLQALQAAPPRAPSTRTPPAAAQVAAKPAPAEPLAPEERQRKEAAVMTAIRRELQQLMRGRTARRQAAQAGGGKGGDGAADEADAAASVCRSGGSMTTAYTIDQSMLASLAKDKQWEELPNAIRDLDEAMPGEISRVPMRLIKVDAILSWDELPVYEEVSPEDCMDLPYTEVAERELWSQTAVLSWRWGAQKPGSYTPGFSPMLGPQFSEFKLGLQQLRASSGGGIAWVWIDWSCVPQYSAGSMTEVMRSKAFYARARACLVVPTYEPLPDGGFAKLLLARARRFLSEQSSKGSASAAANVLGAMLDKELVASRTYFSRVWTLAERIARFGREEQLCHWMSLEAWLGMLADAMLSSTEDGTASAMYRKLLGPTAGRLLEEVVGPLTTAVQTASMHAVKGLEQQVARLFMAGVDVWRSASRLSEAPTTQWLAAYLGEIDAGGYQAWSEADKVWAIYSYFSWNRRTQDEAGLIEAIRDLVRVVGGGGEAETALLASVAVKLDLGERLLAEAARIAEEEARKLPEAGRKAAEAARRKQLEEAVKLELQALAASGANGGGEGGGGRGVRRGVRSPAQRLLEAARVGDEPEVQRLLAAGAKLSAANEAGRTALHGAVEGGQVGTLQALIQAGGDVEAADKSGWRPLHMACTMGRVEAARVLLAAGASPQAPGENGVLPLALAIRSRRVELLLVLGEAGVDLDARDEAGRTPLWMSASEGDERALRTLLHAKAQIDLPDDKDGQTALAVAAVRGHTGAVRTLLLAGANAEAMDKEGMTPLALAARAGRLGVVRALLLAGARADNRTSDGRTALEVAQEAGKAEVARALKQAGAVDAKEEAEAARLRAQAEKEAAAAAGRVALLAAVRGGQAAEVRQLLEEGVAPDAQDETSYTALGIAAAGGRVAMVRALLQAGARPDTAPKGELTPLARAVAEGRAATARALLLGGANAEALDHEGLTPLQVAVRAGHRDIAQALVQAGANTAPIESDQRKTDLGRELLAAAKLGGLSQVEALLVEGAKADVSDEEGLTAVHLAARQGHADTVRALLRAGADANAQTTAFVGQGGRTPLHFAAAEGRLEALRALLAGGASHEAADWFGRTPLVAAAVFGDVEAVQALLSAGASVHAADKDQRTPLHYAARKGHWAVARALLQAGADPLARDKNGRTPLDAAPAGSTVAELIRVSAGM